MCSRLRTVVLPVLLWMGVGFGQAVPANSPDPFGDVHARLSTAADKTLASALADRPWMRPAIPEAGATLGQPARALRVQRFRAGIERVQQLRPIIEPILREEGVPPELIAVALVESGGQATALSPSGARGVWQFMPDTARRYGLTVTAGRDERLDVTKSTRAAARYLRDLRRQFGDWQLAFAAYNAGEQAIERVLARKGQREFFAVRGLLPLETRNYVPAVVSAMSLFGDVLDEMRPPHSSAGPVLYASSHSGR